MGWKEGCSSGDYPIKGRSSFCLALQYRTGGNESRYDSCGDARQFRWNAGSAAAQDCDADGIPYRTFFRRRRNGMWRRDGKWGRPFHGIRPAATDLITGKENPYVNLFTPSRLGWNGAVNLAKQAGCSLKGYVGRKKVTAGEYLEDLEPGEGHLVEYGKGKIGAYRDEEGALHLVTARCPHLGCELTWNPDEKSWDCPCHGSRFDYEGRVLDGPAQEGIGLVWES
ncbi:MAG: Rieske 2Fe-2S domain-containing protein [Eisenbergiella sp.]